MIDFGFSDQGFKPKNIEDVRDSQDEKSKELFGDDVNLEESSPLKRFNDVEAPEIASLYDAISNLYNGIDARKATGDQQDKLYGNLGVPRDLPKNATVDVVITGIDTVIVPVDFIVETGSKVQFIITEEKQVTGGTATVAAVAIEEGIIGNVGIGEINTFVTLIAGLDSVTNLVAASGGSEKQSNEDYRDEYFEVIGTEGEDAAELIRTEILKVDGVESAKVTENDTEATVGGIPEKSFESIVQGGTDADVASAILIGKPFGIRAFGQTTTETVQNSQGDDVDIGITRPTEIDIYIDVTVTENEFADANLQTNVQTALVNFVNALDVSDDVIYNLLITETGKVQGVGNIDLKSSKTAVPIGTIDIPIAATEIARTENAKVNVVVI